MNTFFTTINIALKVNTGFHKEKPATATQVEIIKDNLTERFKEIQVHHS